MPSLSTSGGGRRGKHNFKEGPLNFPYKVSYNEGSKVTRVSRSEWLRHSSVWCQVDIFNMVISGTQRVGGASVRPNHLLFNSNQSEENGVKLKSSCKASLFTLLTVQIAHFSLTQLFHYLTSCPVCNFLLISVAARAAEITHHPYLNIQNDISLTCCCVFLGISSLHGICIYLNGNCMKFGTIKSLSWEERKILLEERRPSLTFATHPGPFKHTNRVKVLHLLSTPSEILWTSDFQSL